MRGFFVVSLLAGTVFLSADATKSSASSGEQTSLAEEVKKVSESIDNGFKMVMGPWFKSLEEKLDQLITVLNTSVHENSKDKTSTFTSCREIYLKHLSKGNRAYMLYMDSKRIPIYCYMDSIGLGACGGGGWTLALKIDGAKRNFHYDSKFWSNKIDLNLPGGRTGLDIHETKLPTYWTTPFSKICLGMRIGNHLKLIVINKHASSLYSLIADGVYRSTSVGRDVWKLLIGSQASLQLNCNKEGFNVKSGDDGSYAKARIGILGNNNNDCDSCDSRIGFGTGGLFGDSNTCGNVAYHGGDNGDKDIKAMGYILVQ